MYSLWQSVANWECWPPYGKRKYYLALGLGPYNGPKLPRKNHIHTHIHRIGPCVSFVWIKPFTNSFSLVQTDFQEKENGLTCYLFLSPKNTIAKGKCDSMLLIEVGVIEFLVFINFLGVQEIGNVLRTFLDFFIKLTFCLAVNRTYFVTMLEPYNSRTVMCFGDLNGEGEIADIIYFLCVVHVFVAV